MFQEERKEGDLSSRDPPLADHALVIMYRPYLSSWVQPIAVFAAKNAVPGEQLEKIVRRAIVTLENVGAKVLNITCDGASTNKTMSRLLGINGENTDTFSCSIKNPFDPERKIWYLWDPPHAFKCVRNHLFNVKIVQARNMIKSVLKYKITI